MTVLEFPQRARRLWTLVVWTSPEALRANLPIERLLPAPPVGVSDFRIDRLFVPTTPPDDYGSGGVCLIAVGSAPAEELEA